MISMLFSRELVFSQRIGVYREEQFFQVLSKRRGSMKSHSLQHQNVIFVQYCRSCQTHSWCTHHDQAKYHQNYLKLSEMIAQKFPQLEVIGNMLPDHLIPFKIAENKYIDSNTNKYVMYPQIGSFEVTFAGQLVYSKKETNAWPNIASVVHKIAAILDPNYQSPEKIEKSPKQSPQRNEHTPSKGYKYNGFLKSNDQKKTHYKEQSKGFTLTDHFKLYRPKQKLEQRQWLSEKPQSDGSSRQISQLGRGDSREKSDKSDSTRVIMKDFTGDNKIKQMLKTRGVVMKEHGKKEMIIKLDSIEEENALYDDNGMTQRSHQKHSKKKRMQELEDGLASLENKVMNFQTKYKDFQTKNQQFQLKNQPIQELSRSRNKVDSSQQEDSRTKLKQLPSFEKTSQYYDRPSKLEQYLNATQQEKNQKLHRIYGQWKILKQTAKKNQRMLKKRRKESVNEGSSEEQSNHGNSPSAGQILTFKPKPASSIQQKITSLLKGQKNSGVDKYQNTHLNEPKFRTEDHFYNKDKIKDQKPQRFGSEQEPQPISKQIRKNYNTMSLQTLKNHKNNSSSTKPSNQSKLRTQTGVQVSHFSHQARQSINKIQSRMSKLQAKLSQHKGQTHLPDQYNENQHPYYKSRSNSHSETQSNHSAQKNNKKNIGKKAKINQDSHYLTNNSNKPIISNKTNPKKNTVKHYTSPQQQLVKKGLQKQSRKDPLKIEEESQQFDSNVPSREVSHREEHLQTKRKNEKQKATSKESKLQAHYHPNHLHRSISKDSGRDYRSQSGSQKGYRSISKQKSSRIQKHELHQPTTFLRKQKDWKESEQVPREFKNHSHVSQQRDTPSKNRSTSRNNSPQFVRSGKVTKASKHSRVQKHQIAKKSSRRAEKTVRPNQQEYLSEEQSQRIRSNEMRTNIRASAESQLSDLRSNHSGRIVRNSGNRMLDYYKSEDYCYQAQPQTNQQTILLAKVPSDERVEGWRHSEQEEFFEAEQNRVSSNPNESGVESSTSRRNSLDRQIEQLSKKQDTVRPETTPKTPHSKEQKKEALVAAKIDTPKIVKDEEPPKKQKTKKAKKEKKQRKQKARKQSKKATKKKQAETVNTPVDFDKEISDQYVDYLTLKVAHEIASQHEPTNQVENSVYQDQNINVNVMYCPSIDSLAQYQAPPDSFAEYQPPKVQATKTEEQPKGEKFQQSSSDQQKEVQSSEEQQSQEEEKQQEKAQANAIVPVAPVIATSSQPQQSPEAANKVANSPKLAVTRQVEESPQSQQLQDNVYTCSKEGGKVRDIGIQKESSFEVSVQTDHPGTVFMPRTNLMSNRPVTSSSAKKSNRSQFNSTIGNNFFTGTNKFNQDRDKNLQRASIISKLFRPDIQDQIIKFDAAAQGQDSLILKEKGTVKRLVEIYPQGELINDKNLQLQLVETKVTKLLKILQILCQKTDWLVTRLFEDRYGLLKDRVFGVWICKQYSWECVIFDDKVKVNQENQPLFSKHHGKQMWFNVLERVLASTLGGYQQLLKAESSQLFSLLTGCNCISAKIKEDPSKNLKLLHLINDCLRKNYIVHAHKHWEKNKQDGREPIYYILSTRKGAADDTLVELSQDGRQSFWVKLSKFVQQFTNIDILQLRINHNFTNFDLGTRKSGQLTVIDMNFSQEGQGCVTLTYLQQSGSLKAFLYKQEKNKVLKLVGQAKEKNKMHLFFECNFSDGRYYVFAQTQQKSARLAFQGECCPSLKVTEEIHSEGLKNEMAQYLPVKENDENKYRESMNDWRLSRARLKDNFVESRLRQNFVDYVLGRSKRG